jgi:hypothetical protein
MPARLITVAETPLFVRQAEQAWNEAEREDFVLFITANPEHGDLIPKRAASERFVGEGLGLASAAARG